MNDELEGTGRSFGEQLTAIADDLPVREDGRDAIDTTLRRRRRTRRATWTVAAAALILVVVAAGAQLRRSGPAPYVDTSTTVSTTSTTSTPEPGEGPDSVMATVPPLFVPGDGYEWQMVAWRGAYGSTIAVTQPGQGAPFSVRVSASTPSQWAPADPVPDSIQPAVLDGAPVEVHVSSDSQGSTYMVEVEPSTTLLITVADSDESASTRRVIALLASLRRASQGDLEAAALPSLLSSELLVAPGLSALLDSQRGDLPIGSAVTLAIWDERLGWGQILLTVTPGPKGLAAVGTEVEVRGMTGRLVALGAGDGPRTMQLEWQENGYLYSLNFAVELSPVGAIRVAEALRSPTDAEVEALWFPSWRPLELPRLGDITR